MKIEMCELDKININVDEIKNINFKNEKKEKGIFTLSTNQKKYIANIDNAFDYFYLYDFLRSICPDKLYKKWLSEIMIRDVNAEVNCVWNTIKIDRIAKKMNIEIDHNEIFHILLNDYNNFGYNAMIIGNFENNVKKAVSIFQTRKVA